MREGKGKETFFVFRPFRFIQEAVWSVIDAMEVEDPLELFDKVMIVEREFAKARQNRDDEEDD